MRSFAKPFNRVFFLLCVLITGSLAGAFVWLFFFLMDEGISFLWQTLPGWIGSVTAEPLPVLSQGPFGFVPFPLIVCVLGGLVIGLYAKHTGVEPEDLNSVMGKGQARWSLRLQPYRQALISCSAAVAVWGKYRARSWPYGSHRRALHLGGRQDA